MKDKIKLPQFFEDLARHLDGTEPAAEELRQALNAVIARHGLHCTVVLSLLARLSAAYIHLTQQAYNRAGASENVEQDFLSLLTGQLTELDLKDVEQEMERMRREEMN